jgi:proteasome assembly chaperone (PAC2) family protein
MKCRSQAKNPATLLSGDMMENDIWINRISKPRLRQPVAIVGSPGLRSIGKLAIDQLIARTGAKLMAELYSTHLPTIYQTTPSYAAHPSLPGMGGAIVEAGKVDFPKVQFYAATNPSLILVRGYHANFQGQYDVAEKVTQFLTELHVKQMIVVAGYGSKEKNIVCATTSEKKLVEMKNKFGVGVGYKGPFMGFSGLVFGFSKVKGMEAVCLFAGTQPPEEDLESPDIEASDRAVQLLAKMLELEAKAKKKPEPVKFKTLN